MCEREECLKFAHKKAYGQTSNQEIREKNVTEGFGSVQTFPDITCANKFRLSLTTILYSCLYSKWNHLIFKLYP